MLVLLETFVNPDPGNAGKLFGQMASSAAAIVAVVTSHRELTAAAIVAVVTSHRELTYKTAKILL